MFSINGQQWNHYLYEVITEVHLAYKEDNRVSLHVFAYSIVYIYLPYLYMFM